MLILITGASASGKSEFAENKAVSLCRNKLIYIATMRPFDEECRDRIKKHRLMRAGKGFETIECYENIGSLKLTGKPTVLLECMSNLAANEMYNEKGERTGRNVCEEVLGGINRLLPVCENVIIVTNEVFSDGGSAYEETIEYIKNLGFINVSLGEIAEEVYEVVCKIPVRIK